jgi:hypothetical protein
MTSSVDFNPELIKQNALKLFQETKDLESECIIFAEPFVFLCIRMPRDVFARNNGLDRLFFGELFF